MASGCLLSERLCVCMERRPPLMTFLLCFMALAIAFAAFGTYVGSHEVRNSDFVEDWNTFLQALTRLQFCTNGDLNGSEVMSLNPALRKHAASPLVDRASLNTSAVSNRWVSVSLLAHLVFHSSGVPEPGTGLWRIIMAGHQLGLKGAGAKELINITVMSPRQKRACGKGQACPQLEIPGSCITVMASASILPQTRRPPECSMDNFTNSQILSQTVFASQKADLREGTSCYQVDYYPDPTLTIRLSEDERSVCKIRLMYASLLLLFLTGLILCFAAVCTHPSREKWTRVHL
ncbi:insulin-like growth factor-binding protein 3 receptor isoform X2 [Rhinatrema bivittatum]|nr:insulin-like growth factor-binding protein 3 receptor isoform X2 [Rhinatrema bivittatum]XP_029462836.1 insulin-like growth factor-binding protein 3 receptor isoform X2 [Rhinatrema bivittatum]XP_029462837.1 insulin-like growth factor-binding protein 3 receptor isoform X2 [Rhinatrema bivittatum]